jgi:divalent metal cation (Fe/Co/Zn/Cd) transporter
MTATRSSRPSLQRRALRLEYATIAWNLGEAVFTIVLGVMAGSLALIGFGSDSIIEVFASSVVVWHVRPGHAVDRPERTRRALRLVAFAFVVLGVVLTAAAVRELVLARRAEPSPLGIAYLAATAVVMFSLAIAKRRTAVALASAPLRSEASLTLLDGVLATLTLGGLALNATLGWWWADPVTALVVAVAAFNEARENRDEAEELVGPVATAERAPSRPGA